MYLLIMLFEAIVAVFQVRSLLQSTGSDYYHPVSQAVTKVTEPVMKLLPFKNYHFGRFFYAGFIVSLIISVVFWVCVVLATAGLNILFAVLMGLLMTVKTFGYLVVVLMLVQAITSWLPSTRSLSYFCSQLTAPLVAPVQKVIPPIGMIDISLMIVLIAIFALNRLMLSWLQVYWYII